MKCRSKWWGLLIAVILIVPAMRADEAARWSHRELPSYPSFLRNLKIGGHVRLTVTLSTDGKVKQATVRGGNPMLAELSCLAVKKWAYNGPPTDPIVELEFVFDPGTGNVKLEGE